MISFAKGFAKAFASLGHIAFEIEKDVNKAVQYWLEGWRKGKDLDCAFNLGSMWAEGLYPNASRNLV